MDEKEKKELVFTLVFHQIRKRLKLLTIEYMLADSIYHLSNNPKNKTGWCYAPKTKLANFIGFSERTIYNALNSLLEKGFIERNKETKYLKTTEKWGRKYGFTLNELTNCWLLPEVTASHSSAACGFLRIVSKTCSHT